MKELLEKLSHTYGPSGNEENIRKVIEGEIEKYVDEIKTDVMGNLIAVKRGNGKKIMIAAHMDQIGLIITHIDDNGFLRFSNIGGVAVYNSIHRKVRFSNGLTGVIGYETELEDWKNIKLDKMFIDIGAKNRSEAEEQIAIGDVAVYNSPFSVSGGRYIGGAMDNRAGCALVIETIKQLKETDHEIYFVFTVQEELGLRGAKTSSFTVNPDMAIAVDVTLTGDTPKSKPMDVSLGKGPAIKVKDNSVICHPLVKNLMTKRAKESNIPYQYEILERGGTDAGAIHLSREGVPSGVLSIPCRYVHSDNEMVDGEDMKNGVELLLEILQNDI